MTVTLPNGMEHSVLLLGDERRVFIEDNSQQTFLCAGYDGAEVLQEDGKFFYSLDWLIENDIYGKEQREKGIELKAKILARFAEHEKAGSLPV